MQKTMKANNETNALKILHKKYVASKPERELALERERLNAKVARMICDFREEAGLTQQDLANLIGTTQSVISRLEDADYDGHSLSMVQRIATALNKKLSLDMKESSQASADLKYAFQKLLYLSRKKRNWSIDTAAKQLGIKPSELQEIELAGGNQISPALLYKLSEIYEVPQEKLAFLAGAFKTVPKELKQDAALFATQSDSLDEISPKERKLLDGFVRILRTKY